MSKSLIRSTLFASLVVMAVSGCAQSEKQLVNAPQSTLKTVTAAESSPTPKPTPSPEVKQSKVKVYYSDADQMKLIEKEVNVSYKQDADKYEAAFNALKKSEDPAQFSLFTEIVFKTVTFDAAKGELKLDLTFGPGAQFGAPGEDLFLQAIKKTGFQFAEVKEIYVLKNGKQEESLMGHLDMPYPIKRNK
ncbi:Sporulation and spore germination [compost metagenome]